MMDKKVYVLPKPIPYSEADRCVEATELIKQIGRQDAHLLTTWDVETLESIKAGRAVTRIRLIELREMVERVKKQREEEKSKSA